MTETLYGGHGNVWPKMSINNDKIVFMTDTSGYYTKLYPNDDVPHSINKNTSVLIVSPKQAKCVQNNLNNSLIPMNKFVS